MQPHIGCQVHVEICGRVACSTQETADQITDGYCGRDGTDSARPGQACIVSEKQYVSLGTLE